MNKRAYVTRASVYGDSRLVPSRESNSETVTRQTNLDVD